DKEHKRTKKFDVSSSIQYSMQPPPQRTPAQQRSPPRSSTDKPQDSELPPETQKTGDHFEYMGGDDEEVREPLQQPTSPKQVKKP
ncbi:hypothetical protein, partial [Salmonella enterica]|uniref:hypothetical protein n=1 Tax=Salmonella enterica TaxID=28901 RepID=UPI0020C4EC3F